MPGPDTEVSVAEQDFSQFQVANNNTTATGYKSDLS